VRRQIVPVSHTLLPGAMSLVERTLAGGPYLEGSLDSLRAASTAPSADGRALASIDGERMDGPVAGVLVFGFFGGASGAGRLLFTVVDSAARRGGVGHALVEAAIGLLRDDGARFVLAELPDDPGALPGARPFLESLGFRQESRIEHFYRDGIALSFMRRELDTR
jgi:ribosomal protein S18 acetylase RimI-like enzyme